MQKNTNAKMLARMDITMHVTIGPVVCLWEDQMPKLPAMIMKTPHHIPVPTNARP
jgi:hypothetical protein